ncbi:MAG TPA: acyl-CoA dehydrogenase [Solirubrobacteraceae bacterium]|nr:acyl-CoA dehydrogenase [Solirubrobacteraceae bacterium]
MGSHARTAAACVLAVPISAIAPRPTATGVGAAVDLSLSAEQEQLVDAFSALYAKESPTERVRAAEPAGFDAELWARLFETGVLEMSVGSPSAGTAQGPQEPAATLLDLALVAEQHGRHLGSAPLVETQVAARLLDRCGTDRASELLHDALRGEALVTLALRPPRAGPLRMVPGGAVADRILFLDGDRLCVAEAAANRSPVANLGSLPVADVDLKTGSEEVEAAPGVPDLYSAALDEWMILTANALVGLGSRALEIGVAYVKERRAFGVPIGSFQAVAQGLADAATAMDGSQLLAREAAWSAGADASRTGELAPMALGFCAESARMSSYRSLHYHGGYGFMLEYDIQLFWRRAKAWPAVWGGPDEAYSLAAARRLAGRTDAPARATTPIGASSSGEV